MMRRNLVDPTPCPTPAAGPLPQHPWSLAARVCQVALAAALSLATGAALAQAQASVAPLTGAAHAPKADIKTFNYDLQARRLADQVYVIEGSVDDFSKANGCNIINTGFIVTSDGVVVINTGPSKKYGEQQLAAIRKVTPKPISAVVNLNLHPDYFFGNQAFAASTLMATDKTFEGIKAESKAYEDNLYRLCGDWMLGTETALPAPVLKPGGWTVGGRSMQLIELQGHTGSDLVLIDEATGVVFAGGLVFYRRGPTTPHADLPVWITSLDQLKRALQRLPGRIVVPSHGPVHAGDLGLDETRQFAVWLDARFKQAALEGREMIEVLKLPLPEPFKSMAGIGTEYARNVFHLYPRYERAVLQQPK